MKWLREYFNLTRREETGIAALLILIAVLIAGQYFSHCLVPPHKQGYTREEITKWFPDSVQRPGALVNEGLAPFDPNTMSDENIKKLGLPEKVALHWINYRSKGGRFGAPEDLKKIYGLTEEDYLRLEPFIKITGSHVENAVVTDLNTADSVQLVAVNGIGPVFASRILKLRHDLGAFVKKEQLMDVYGIDSMKYVGLKSQLKLSHGHIRQLNINTATAAEMAGHPYIRYKLANIIVNYRKAHGAFAATGALKNILAIDTEALEKLTPYITVK